MSVAENTFDERIAQLKAKSLLNTDLSTYGKIHYWVKRQFGKADHCSIDKSHETTRYHWSNISGEYKRERSDWRQLCPSCHKKLDYTNDNREIKRLQGFRNTSRRKAELKIYPNGSWIKYASCTIAATETGLWRANICNVAAGRVKSAGGFTWRYPS